MSNVPQLPKLAFENEAQQQSSRDQLARPPAAHFAPRDTDSSTAVAPSAASRFPSTNRWSPTTERNASSASLGAGASASAGANTGAGAGVGVSNERQIRNPWSTPVLRANQFGESETDSVRSGNFALRDYTPSTLSNRSAAHEGPVPGWMRQRDAGVGTGTGMPMNANISIAPPAPSHPAPSRPVNTFGVDNETDEGDLGRLPGYTSGLPGYTGPYADGGESYPGDANFTNVGMPAPTYQATLSNPSFGHLNQPAVLSSPRAEATRISFRGDGKGVLTPICLRHADANIEEKAFFLFNPDSTRYDNTVQVRVTYRRNNTIQDCLENRLLNLEGHETVSERLTTIAKGIEFYVRQMTDFHFPATEIWLSTRENGEVIFNAEPDYEVVPEHAIPQYPDLPASLAHLPRAPYGALTKVATLKYEVDLVRWAEDPAGPPHEFAFKRTMASHTVLAELEALTTLRDSPHIVPLTAVVVDTPRAGTTRVRGFLTPYYGSGDLKELLIRFAAAANPAVNLNALARAPAPVSWNTKLVWVHSIARAVQAAHGRGIVHGDLKPDNVVLTSMTSSGTQGVKLIDFGPVGPTRGWGAPEYVQDWVRYLNAALEIARQGKQIPEYDFKHSLIRETDVWGIGALMWVIGEEKPGVAPEELPRRKWAKSPNWYVSLAEACLREDPTERPTVSSILFKLRTKKPALFFV